MRRTHAALVALVVGVGAVASGCSSVAPFRQENPTTPPVATPADPIPSSQVFGTAFAVSDEGGDATLTLDNLRIPPSTVYADTVIAIDLRAVQASGRPVVDPARVHAFDPGGREFERIRYPKGTVSDPLVRSELTAAGQEVRGTVAWTMPVGGRVGRIDVSTPSSINSLTVVRQPIDPEASAASPTSTGG